MLSIIKKVNFLAMFPKGTNKFFSTMIKWLFNLLHIIYVTVWGLANRCPFRLTHETYGITQRVLNFLVWWDVSGSACTFFDLSHFSKEAWSLLVKNYHLKTTVWALRCSLILSWLLTQRTELGDFFFFFWKRKIYHWWRVDSCSWVNTYPSSA